MKYPENIKDEKSKFFYWLSWHEYNFNMGRKVIGKITSMFPDLGWSFAAAMFLLNRRLSPTEILVFSVLAMVLAYLLGRFWVKHKADKIQTQVIQERDPLMKNIYDSVVKNKGKL